MVKYSAKLDATFAALSDPTRRAILARLARGDALVGKLAQPFDMSLPAFSKHLRVLQRAGLLSQDRQGRVRLCQLRPAPLRAAAVWIERYRRFWTRQLDALAEYFDEMEEDSPGESHSRKPQTRKRRKQT